MNHINKILSKRNERIYLISYLDDQASGLVVFTKSPGILLNLNILFNHY